MPTPATPTRKPTTPPPKSPPRAAKAGDARIGKPPAPARAGRPAATPASGGPGPAPRAAKAAKAAKPAKDEKPKSGKAAKRIEAAAAADAAPARKTRLVRDSFTMPEGDFALIDQLKARAIGFGHPVKKSELLRAGLQALAALADAELGQRLSSVPRLKTGRPGKHG